MNTLIMNKIDQVDGLRVKLDELDDTIKGLIEQAQILDDIAALEDEITRLVNTYDRLYRRYSARQRSASKHHVYIK